MNGAGAFVFVFFPFVYFFGWKYGSIAFVITIIGIIATFWINDKNRRAYELEMLNLCIDKHLQELALKHRQLTFSANYGIIDPKKWKREQKRFLDLVFRPRIEKKILLDELTLQNVIDDAIEKYNSSEDRKELVELGEGTSGIDYEMHCASLLKKCGWDAQTTTASGDQGADIIAYKNGIKLVVQCKFYSTSNVGNAAVQEVSAAKAFYEADLAVVLSNAAYTQSAKQLAKSLRIQLLHHNQVDSIGDIQNRAI